MADNIGYGLELAGVPEPARKERIATSIAQAGLKGFERAYPSALSGGMRQRAALMRTLVVEPRILLMDEPFGALDTHTKIDMHEVLLRIWEREQQTVLFVTHDLGEALTLAGLNHSVLRPAGSDQGPVRSRLRAAARCREGARDPTLCPVSSTFGIPSARNSQKAAGHEGTSRVQHARLAGCNMRRGGRNLAVGL